MEKIHPLFKIAKLISSEISNGLTDAEKQELQRWISESESNRLFYNKIRDGESLISKLNEIKKFDAGRAFTNAEQRIAQANRPNTIFRSLQGYLKYAAAILLLAVCSYFIVNKLVRNETPLHAQNSLSPGKQRAILVTAGHRRILLDSTEKIQTIRDESVEIIHSGSALVYPMTETVEDNDGKLSHNILITPRGGEYTVVLSDGTRVILNADSRLEYPVFFGNHLREVILEGEAFFKVSKSEKTPFTVKAKDVNITVYGTAFNVSAYGSENMVQTTLVEGSIGVNVKSSKTLPQTKIYPGQQFTYDNATGTAGINDVDAERFIAWTKGMFIFENEPLVNILEDLSRWYDFTFEFKEDELKQQRFTLSIGRYENATRILDLISMSSDIKFSVSGDSVIVSAK